MNRNGDLRRKIDEARRRLPMPELMAKLGLAEHAKQSAHCPLPGHDDKHSSFSVFQGKDGFWFWKCHAGCGEGDEILFLKKFKGLSTSQAMNLYLDMAGFPAHCLPKSHEYPSVSSVSKSRESLSISVSEFPEYPACPVSPVSNGQELPEIVRALAARNACRKRGTASKALFQLVRHLSTVEKRAGQEAEIAALTPFFDEWYRLSQSFLDLGKPRDHYLAEFIAGFRKVRVLIGEGDTINKALQAVSKLSADELPVIPGIPDAPESWRRLAALHRELSPLSANGTYFLSYRDAAKVCNDLSHQEAHTITGALARLGVIKIVRKGQAGLNGGKAAEFRYLLSQNENDAEDDQGFVL